MAKRRNMGSVHITQLKEEYQQMGHLKDMTDMVLHTLPIYAIAYNIEWFRELTWG